MYMQCNDWWCGAAGSDSRDGELSEKTLEKSFAGNNVCYCIAWHQMRY